MTAPTSRGFGDGRDDRGRAPLGSRAAPIFTSFSLSPKSTFCHVSAILGRTVVQRWP